MKQVQPARAMDIDYIKAIAIVGVLVIHTTSAGYKFPVMSFNWIASVFWGSVSRASVPLFFMCSGALLLRPEKPLSLKKLYGRNILRILVVLLIWGMAYKIWSLAASESLSPATLLHAFKEVLLFKHVFHFYYLHITLLVYALLPVTRLLVAHASNREWQYMLGAWFVLGIAYPTFRHFWPASLITGFPLQWMLNMTYAAVGYGLLGYRLREKNISTRQGVFLTGLGMLVILGGTTLLSARDNTLNEFFFEGMSIGVCLLAVGLFTLGLRISGQTGTRGQRENKSGVPSQSPDGTWFKHPGSWATRLSKASFCIYLVHVFFIYLFEKAGLTVLLFPCLFSIPVIALLNLTLSYGVYLIMKRIPIVNRWLV